MAHRNQNREEVTSIVSVRGQTIIPKRLREASHIHEGDRIQWHLQKGGLFVERLVVRPAREADALTEQEWKQLDRLVRRQRKARQFTRYASLEDAKMHSRKLAKHAR